MGTSHRVVALLAVVASVIAPALASAQSLTPEAERNAVVASEVDVTAVVTPTRNADSAFIGRLSGVTPPDWGQSPSTLAIPTKPHHRFFDSPNIALTAVESIPLVVAAGMTHHALTTYPTQAYEGDPIVRPLLRLGWPGYVAGVSLFVSAEVGLRYALHRWGHHRLERVLPLMLTAWGIADVIHDAQEFHQLKR
jgi:hypothetical protein